MPSKYLAHPVRINHAFASYRLGALIIILLFFRACSLASQISDKRFFACCLCSARCSGPWISGLFCAPTWNNRRQLPVSRKNCWHCTTVHDLMCFSIPRFGLPRVRLSFTWCAFRSCSCAPRTDRHMYIHSPCPNGHFIPFPYTSKCRIGSQSGSGQITSSGVLATSSMLRTYLAMSPRLFLGTCECCCDKWPLI